MTILSTYLKRVFARPWMILLTVAAPALIVVLTNVGGNQTGIGVAFFDYDRSALSRAVADAIAPVSRFVELEEEEIGEALLDGRIQYALILPEGIEDEVLRGERARVRTHSLQGVEMTGSVGSAADAVLSAAHNIARYVDGDRDAFARALALSADGRFTVQTETRPSERVALSRSAAAGVSQLVGMVTLTMLIVTLMLSLYFLQDIQSGVFHRALVSPVSVSRYMIETNAAFSLATLLQGIATAVVVAVVFPGLNIEVSLSLALVLTVFTLVAVSFALAVAGIAKTVRRAQLMFNILLIPMAMLGGAFWPVEIMPPFFQRVSDFTPIRWVTSATQELLSGAGFTEIVPHLGVLLLFAVVFQFLSSWRRVDIAK